MRSAYRSRWKRLDQDRAWAKVLNEGAVAKQAHEVSDFGGLREYDILRKAIFTHIVLALAPVMLSASLSAQGVFSNKTQTVVEKVIQDYPNHFYNIKGELIGQVLQTARYRSTLQLPGAASSTITLAAASGTEGSGWTCNVLQTASFEEATARFSEMYGQLSNSIISVAGQRTFILSGVYETPAPDKKENEVLFSLLPGVGEMKRLRVELILLNEGQDWVVAISVNDGGSAEQAQLVVNGR